MLQSIRNIRLIFSLLCISLFGAQARAWEALGHDVVAEVASRRLSAEARQAVDGLLEGRSMVYWAYWLENASYGSEYGFTLPWHYIYFADGQEYDEGFRHSSRGDIVTAIRQEAAILADSDARKADRCLALKILIHLVADIHNPLHVGRSADYGGSRVAVKWFGYDTSLRYVWEGAIMDTAHDWSYTEWADQIMRVPEAEINALRSTDIDRWVEESKALADEVYSYFPEGKDIDIDDVVVWAPTIESRLLAAGVRLAALLDEALCGKTPNRIDPTTISYNEQVHSDIYSLQGILLRHDADISTDPAKATEGLPAGLYIIGGKKVFIRR